MSSPSSVFAARLADLRRVRGWTTQDLSDRLRDLGVDLHPTAITKIEKRVRGITLDEVVAIAVAFHVPPVMMWLPLDTASFDITPRKAVNPWLVLGWVRNKTPLMSSDIAAWRDWTQAAYDLDERHRDRQHEVNEADMARRRAEFQNDPELAATAQRKYIQALEAVADAWRATERHGFMPPALPSAWVDDMAELGMDPSPNWRLNHGEN